MAKQKVGKKRKSELVFDPKKRRDFLSGFRKRKQERREKAKSDLEKQVKEEEKRIKKELRDGFQEQFKKSFAPIELEGRMKEKEYDDPDGNVTVQVVELSCDDIAKSNNWIGSNRPVYESDEASENEESEFKQDEGEHNLVPGFDTLRNPSKKVSARNDDVGKKAKSTTSKKFKGEFKSKRAMGQYLAKQAQSSLNQSKAFQTKNKLEKIRNKKKARIEKDKRIKLQNKREKHKKNSVKSEKPSNKFGKKAKRNNYSI